MGLEKVIAKALGISDEEIEKASRPELDEETEHLLKTAEDLAEDIRAGRISKRDFSADERKKAAGSGAAMSDGSFPIHNESDLRNAVKAVGRASDPAKARAHIVARAKSLGLTSLLPDDWKVSKSDESTDEPGTVESMGDEITIEQAKEAIEEHDDRLDAIEKAVEELPAKLVKAMKDKDEEEETPTADELSSKLDKIAKDTADQFEEIGEKITKLGSGGSDQADDDEGEKPEAKTARIEKAFKDRDLDPSLAGIFGDEN